MPTDIGGLGDAADASADLLLGFGAAGPPAG
jgi:hypothetical protein